MSNFSFSHSVFKRLVSQGASKGVIVWERVNTLPQNLPRSPAFQPLTSNKIIHKIERNRENEITLIYSFSYNLANHFKGEVFIPVSIAITDMFTHCLPSKNKYSICKYFMLFVPSNWLLISMYFIISFSSNWLLSNTTKVETTVSGEKEMNYYQSSEID